MTNELGDKVIHRAKRGLVDMRILLIDVGKNSRGNHISSNFIRKVGRFFIVSV